MSKINFHPPICKIKTSSLIKCLGGNPFDEVAWIVGFGTSEVLLLKEIFSFLGGFSF